MAVDAYMIFLPYGGQTQWDGSESQADWSGMTSGGLAGGEFVNSNTTALASGGDKIQTFGKIFELEDYSFDIEQTLNIGSQGGGAGAGKVTFNPFSITRKIDNASPMLFQMACSGTPFSLVSLALRKASGNGVSGQVFARFDFKLVAVKTISWAHDDESPKETVTFEYGAMVIRYTAQNPDGTFNPVKTGGWNRVKNVSDMSPTADLSKTS